ncbi:MAG: type III-B CRISPR module-associated protein Cmr3 [bacterium]
MKQKLKLFIRPNDVLFFRDGRPFDAGGDYTGRLAFPPTPVTFYGAIRAAILGQKASNFSQFKTIRWPKEFDSIGLERKKRTLCISDFGLALARKGATKIERIYPIPLDVAKKKDDKAYLILSPHTASASPITLNFPIFELRKLHNLNAVDSKGNPDILETPVGFLTESGMKKYLNNKAPTSSRDIIPTHDIFQVEPRVGIRRDNISNTAETGYIYTLEFARLGHAWREYQIGFVIEINTTLLETDAANVRLLRLGGEARSAAYQADVDWVNPDEPTIGTKFKLILLTPAIFNNDWLPDFIDPDSLCGSLDNGKINVKLVSAAVGKYVGIGGWDIRKGRAKPVRRAVPAGSVYFFQSVDDTPFDSQRLIENAYLKSIHEHSNLSEDSNLIEQGLGLTISGSVWNSGDTMRR